MSGSMSGDHRSGLILRASLGRSHADATLTRGAGLADVDTRAVSAALDAVAASAEASYGIDTASGWRMAPSAGLRWQQATRAAYDEGDDLAFAARHDAAEMTALTLTLGLTVDRRITADHRLQMRVAAERDLAVSATGLAGTSTVPGLESFAIDTPLARRESRGVVDVAHLWSVGPAQTLRASLRAATPTHGSGIDTSGSVTMMFSF